MLPVELFQQLKSVIIRIPTRERVVIDGDLMTAAGVSAGIDMALLLAAELCGEPTAKALQLGIEYAPDPPFRSGSIDTATPEIIELAKAIFSGSAGD